MVCLSSDPGPWILYVAFVSHRSTSKIITEKSADEFEHANSWIVTNYCKILQQRFQMTCKNAVGWGHPGRMPNREHYGRMRVSNLNLLLQHLTFINPFGATHEFSLGFLFAKKVKSCYRFHKPQIYVAF